jgi:DNA-binding Xre family transcriptional regulator
VKAALQRNRFARQVDLAEALSRSRDTISKFFNGKPISYLNFLEICEKLGLNLEEIADFETEESQSSEGLSFDKRLQRIESWASSSDSQSIFDVTESQSLLPLDERYRRILFKRLLEIDFIEQQKQVEKVIESHQIAAFVVHGKPAYGQQVLVKRLFDLISDNGKPVPFYMSSNGIGKRHRSMWNHLSRQLQSEPNTDIDEIVDKVCEWWQTQNVFLMVHDVDCMLPELMLDLLENFWKPIVNKAYQHQHLNKRKTSLILFIIDNEGNCHSKLKVLKDWNEPEFPRLPLLLPAVCEFPADILNHWIKKAVKDEILPEGLTAEIVLKDSDNGIPEDVYKRICQHCHCGSRNASPRYSGM